MWDSLQKNHIKSLKKRIYVLYYKNVYNWLAFVTSIENFSFHSTCVSLLKLNLNLS